MSSSSSSTRSYRFITNRKCPFAQKVWIALEAMSPRPNYALEEVSLYGSGGKPGWFMKMNPAGQVPVLEVVDEEAREVVVDSEAILDYLADASPTSNFRPPALEGRIKYWRGQILRDFLPNGKRAVQSGSSGGLEEVLLRLDQALQEEHGGSPPAYLVKGAEGLTLADIALLPFLQRVAREYPEVLARAPHLKQWYEGPAGTDPAYLKTVRSDYWWWW